LLSNSRLFWLQYSGLQALQGWHRLTDSKQGDLISFLLFFENKELRIIHLWNAKHWNFFIISTAISRAWELDWFESSAAEGLKIVGFLSCPVLQENGNITSFTVHKEGK
jgi:hypothetical protein